MKHVNISNALLGGFFGTFVMTILLYLAPLAGIPKMDIAAMLGSLFGHGIPATVSGLWWAGMVWHFLNGTIVFSLVYAYFVYGWLPGSNSLRGMIWGIFLWIAMEVVLMPVTGSGVFSDHAAFPLERIFGSFVVHVIYGAVFGAIAGAQAEHAHHMAHPA